MKLFNDIIDLKGTWSRYRGIFWKTVITTVLVVLLLSILVLMAFPSYESVAKILLKPSREEIVFAREIGSLIGGDPPSTMTSTYGAIISGQRLCENTIDLMLKDGYHFEDPDKSRFEIFWESRCEPLIDKLVSLYFVINYGAFRGFPSPYEELVQDLQDNLTVEGMLNTYIIEASLKWNDPEIASQVLQRHCQNFIRYHSSRTVTALSDMLGGFEEERSMRADALGSAESKLREYQEQEGIVSLNEETRLSLEKLADFDAQIHESKTRIEELAGEAQGLESEILSLGSGYISLPGVEIDPDVIQLLTEIEQKETEIALSEPGSEEYSIISRELRSLQEMVRERIILLFGSNMMDEYPQYSDLANRLSIVKAGQVAEGAKLRALEQLASEEQAGIENLPSRELGYARLSRDVSLMENRYLGLEQRIEDVRIAIAVNLNEVSLLETATTPLYPSYPKILPNLISALLAGLVLAFFVTIGIELVKRHLWTPKDVSQVLSDVDYFGTFGDWNND